jgi:surfeit locus 1 family protein
MMSRLVLAFCILAVIGGLTALGIWQLERRSWKLALISRTQERLRSAPTPAPGPAAWPQLSAEHDEYRPLALTGRFLVNRETYVQAVTDLGGGFWVLTPLQTDSGFTVLVNRGFIPPEQRDHASLAARPATGETTVTGLLRISEPGGGFLRANDPAQDRWYSRDVQAIAAARGLAGAAPYFIDAGSGLDPEAWPRGGLTMVDFPNNHLVYAITWFGLAAMLSCATIFAWRGGWRTQGTTWIDRRNTRPAQSGPAC